jgi:hypothetical protein
LEQDLEDAYLSTREEKEKETSPPLQGALHALHHHHHHHHVPAAEPTPPPMPRKNDLVVWLRLTATQRAMYEAFLQSEVVRQALASTQSPLAALNVMKRLCDHPALLSANMTREVRRKKVRRLKLRNEYEYELLLSTRTYEHVSQHSRISP